MSNPNRRSALVGYNGLSAGAMSALLAIGLAGCSSDASATDIPTPSVSVATSGIDPQATEPTPVETPQLTETPPATDSADINAAPETQEDGESRELSFGEKMVVCSAIEEHESHLMGLAYNLGATDGNDRLDCDKVLVSSWEIGSGPDNMVFTFTFAGNSDEHKVIVSSEEFRNADLNYTPY